VLTFEQIKELIELVAKRKLGGLEVERPDFRLTIAGQESTLHSRVAAAPAPAEKAAPVPAAAPPAVAPPVAAAAAAPESAATGAHVLTSPIVGTFYASPSPDAEPFTRAGARVRKGQVLCIIEAMKLMNEIECDVDGTVVQVFPKNSQPVEFGEQLFAIRVD
jgi:acetyl-CoA carboxylase biotin carboxyl carrier protein